MDGCHDGVIWRGDNRKVNICHKAGLKDPPRLLKSALALVASSKFNSSSKRRALA